MNAQFQLAQAMYDQHDESRHLCRDIRKGRDVNVELRALALGNMYYYKTFTVMSSWDRHEVLDSPLSMAACYNPKLAMKMLGMMPVDKEGYGVIGEGSILYSAVLGAFVANPSPLKLVLSLLDTLLRRGLNPDQPSIWTTRTRALTLNIYSNSVLAFLICKGEQGQPFIERLYANPGFSGMVWACSSDFVPPMTAEDFAMTCVKDPKISAAILPILCACRRWYGTGFGNSQGLRRFWIAAVIRAGFGFGC